MVAAIAMALVVGHGHLVGASQPEAEPEAEIDVDALGEEDAEDEGDLGEGEGEDGSAADADPSAPPPKRIQVQVFAAEGFSEAARVTLEAAVAGGARAAGVSKFITDANQADIDALVDKSLERGDAETSKAEELFDELEFEAAGDHLGKAIDYYSQYLSELMLRDGNANKMVGVLIKQVIVSYLNGDEEAASGALAQVFILDANIDYDAKLFPPQLEEFVVQERLLFDELGKGTLKIAVERGSAMVYINGIERGSTPLTIEALPAGPNMVTLRTLGTPPKFVLAKVEGETVSEISVNLELTDSRPRGRLSKARREVGKNNAGKKLHRAASKLKVDGLLLVVPTVKDSSIELVAYVYDMRNGELVSRAEAEVDHGSGAAEASELGGRVMRGAVWKRPLVVAGAKRPPIWKHKYFWPVVGTAAGVAVIGIVIAAAQGGLSPGQKVGLFPMVRF